MKKISFLCATAALVTPVAIYAQETTGTIRGEVTANGAPVGGAEVVIVNIPSGTTSTVTADAQGNFSAAGLRPGGPYRITVNAGGFPENVIEDVQVTAGEPLRLPIDLAPVAEAGQSITVTGTRTRRETSNGPITAITAEEIEGIASINRDIRDIARRDPFVNIDLSNARTIEIAGQNGRLNRFSVDGVQFSDDFGLNNGGLPTSRGPVPFDAIEQLSVKVAPFDVQEGDFQGGAINVVLKSGGNRFRGSAFYTFSDDSITGDRTRGQDINLDFRSEQYGGIISGPIIKDRLFFMVGYEKLDESDPFDEGVGPGFATQIPGLSIETINNVSSIAQSVYGYDTLGLIQNAVEEDEKIVAKLDLNISDNQRASLTYVRNTGTQQFQQNAFTNAPVALGLQSNGYELAEEVNSGVFQLNSQWTDTFSTELRVSYRDYNRDQTPFGGRDFAQFEVCTDQNSVGSITSCAGPRVFFGPDVSRQSNDLNTENTSVDFVARQDFGNHRVKATFGYTDIDVLNLFLQRSLGDIYFDSITDFQNRRAGRFRLGGAVPSLDPLDAAARFSTNIYTFGIQDDWDVTDTLQVQIGARYDLYHNRERPILNTNFLGRAGFSNRETLSGLGVFQPRFGFNWKAADRLIIRGGVGIFAGGTPDVFLSNSFSNTGQLTNQIDISRANPSGAANANLDPVCNLAGNTPNRAAICNAALNGVTGRDFPGAVTGFLTNNTGALAAAPVNAIDPDFDVPRLLRATLSANYEADLGPLGDGWLLGADILYGNTLRGIQYTDIRSVVVGTLPDGRPRYGPLGGGATNNQDLILTNDNRGRSIIGVARVSKSWDFGLSIDASYTRSDIEDSNALTSSTAGSLYSNNAFLDPNSAALGTSIYQIKDQYKLSVDFKREFFGDAETRFSLFGEYRSGRPYSITSFDPSGGRLAVFGTVGTAARNLLYVPNLNDPLVSFGETVVNGVVTQTAAQAESRFNDLVDQLGIAKYRGRIIPKNTQQSPDFFKVDLHVSQEIPVPVLSGAKVKLFADIENLLNLIDSDWGSLRQVAFPQTAAITNIQCLTSATPTGTPVVAVGTPANQIPAGGRAVVATNTGQACAQYRYSNVLAPQENLVSRQSLYQIRVGVRFEF